MKNVFIVAFIVLTLTGYSQTDKTWAFGIGCGLHGNNSRFSGGSDLADGSFNHNPFGSGAIEGLVRYDYNSRWMFMTGFGFTSYGFEFSRNTDHYSLSNEDEYRHNVVRNEFGAIEIPIMAFYKFKLNCRNARWLLGAGFNKLLTGKQQSTESYSTDSEEGTITVPNYLTSEASANGGAFTMFRFAVGRERIMKRGSIVQVGFWINVGFKTLAETTVDYTVDGVKYNHTFTNKGDFVGIRAAYYFRTRKNN